MPIQTLNSIRPVEVLLVDDNPTDTFFMKEVLKRCRFPIHSMELRNGEDALAYLRHQGEFRKAPDPDVVLLDLNIPRINGWEVLKKMREDMTIGPVPVMVVTSSHNDADIKMANELNPDVYLVKPMDMMRFPMLIKSIERLWLGQGHWNGNER